MCIRDSANLEQTRVYRVVRHKEIIAFTHSCINVIHHGKDTCPLQKMCIRDRLSALGYDSYLITDFIAHNGQGDVPSGYVPYMKNGIQVKNLNGDCLLYTSTGVQFRPGYGDYGTDSARTFTG